ncbi:hypothetical protein ACO0LB_16460 [Undibacterium sp. SXout7W]|uniref:hypothetical protein n=1 Tax=Undibacterium sp. SXout7W TaxID=3413049 RepID=UPI003BF212AD
MNKKLNKSQVIQLESARQNKQAILITQIRNEPTQSIVVKNLEISFVPNIKDEGNEKSLLIQKIKKLTFGWIPTEITKRLGMDIEIIRSICNGKINDFSVEYLTEIANKFEKPDYSIFLLNVRDHLDFLYGHCDIVFSLRGFGVSDFEILGVLSDWCDDSKEEITEQTVKLLGAFALADMLVRFVDEKHFEKMQRVFVDPFFSNEVMIFFSELSKIPLKERIEADKSRTSKINSNNASKPRLKGVLDAKILFDEWNDNPNIFSNQATFVSMLIKKGLCKDTSTGRVWLKNFVKKSENEGRLNSGLKKKLPQEKNNS